MTLSLDISELAKHYAAGGRPEDVIAEVYRRIRAADDPAIWISLVAEADAMSRAAAAPKGPLYGIPFAVKDNIDTAGLPTTCACPAFAGTPAQSAFVVELLQAAGAVLIGKTNMDQFATGLVGTRSPYGIPHSVYDKDYISGGSSSGSAVAVARGLVSFALGTDTAGSGRIPAAFNNIVGLKPTKGLISTRGVVPACKSQDTVSIFTLTVSDAVAVAAVAATFDAADPFARQGVCAFETIAPGENFRIGVPVTGLEFFGDSDYERLYHAAIEQAANLGAEIVQVDFGPFREAARLLYSGPWVAERLAALGSFADDKPEAIHEVVRSIILGAKSFNAVDAFKGFYRLAELIRTTQAEWNRMDALLLPTAGTTYRIADVLADPVHLNSNLGAYTNFVNLMDLSALAVPAGFRSDGLPFGITLIGKSFDDGRLALLGDRLHRSLKGTELGKTGAMLANTPPVTPAKPKNAVSLAVVGAHLRGQPLHGQLTERSARFIRQSRTAPGYSLYALANTSPTKPGLVYDGKGTGLIEVEVWEMGFAEFGSFVALIPPPLGIGTLTLEDGETVKGFLCEGHAVRGADDITQFGAWRTWLTSREM